MQRTMEPYLHRDLRDCPAPGREKGNNHVGRNRQLPPRLEALQREPEKSFTSSVTANWPISASPGRTSRRSRGTALTAEILKPSTKAPLDGPAEPMVRATNAFWRPLNLRPGRCRPMTCSPS